MKGLLIIGIVFLVVFGVIGLFKWAINSLDDFDKPNKHNWHD